MAEKNILQVLKSKCSFGIVYHRRDGKNELQTFLETDWGHNEPKQQLVSDYLFMYSDSAILGRSEQQIVIA